MKTKRIICSFAVFVALPGALWGASCSHANLTKCLDSACAINISANPSARCQYCGTAAAGSPVTSKMRAVITGSTKYMLTDKELKSAPSDPGDRYVWATNECLLKVTDCTPDDVSDVYDPLIEQSCTAVCVDNNLQTSIADAQTTTDSETCSNKMTTCMLSDTKCNIDYSNCQTDSDFNRIFSECTLQAPGCEEFIASIKQNLLQSRPNLEDKLKAIVFKHQQSRVDKETEVINGCENNSAYDQCIKTKCPTNENENGCDTDAKKAIAETLCESYKTACKTLK